jgi:outer membrane receptor for ferrienterochelin and colicin
MELTARHKGERFSPAVSVRCNSNGDILLVPEYTMQAGLDYTAGTWTLSGSGTYVDSRSFSFSDTRRLAAYTDVEVGVRKRITPGIELSVAVTNLLSQSIELQPGFVRKAPDAQAGITVTF